MKKIIASLIVISLIFTSICSGAFADNSNLTDKINKELEKLENYKKNTLSLIKSQLKAQNKLKHYEIYKNILEQDYKIVKQNILNEKNDKLSDPTLTDVFFEGYVWAPKGGEVNCEVKSIDYGWCTAYTTYIDRDKTEDMLDAAIYQPGISISTYMASVTAGTAYVYSMGITTLLAQIGGGLVIGLPFLMADLYNDAVRSAIENSTGASKIVYVEDPDGIKSNVTYAWFDYEYMPIPEETSFGYRNVTYKVY